MNKVIQLIWIFLYNKNMPLFMKVHVHWMNLMKNQLYKLSKFWNFERKGYKENDSFFLPFNKKILFNRFKLSSLKCKSYVEEITLPKNMFGFPLKLTLRIFRNFYVSSYKPTYSYTVMYECENSPPPHELS
jgi:hypothetical protein